VVITKISCIVTRLDSRALKSTLMTM